MSMKDITPGNRGNQIEIQATIDGHVWKCNVPFDAWVSLLAAASNDESGLQNTLCKALRSVDPYR